MSLAININKVESFLLTNGNWYQVYEDSFDIDAYEYGMIDDDYGIDHFVLLYQPSDSTSGFRAQVYPEHSQTENVYTIIGPMKSIIAIKYK